MRALLAAVLRDIARRLDDRTPPMAYATVTTTAPRRYEIRGERGPELFVPFASSRVIPKPQP